MNRKLISILICFLLLSQSCFAMTSNELVDRLSSECPEFVQRIYDGGATAQNIADFIEDTETELDNSNVFLTESNFNSVMKGAISKALKYKRNLSFYTALTTQFSSDAIAYTVSGKLPEAFSPVYNFFRKYFLYERERFTDISEFSWADEAVTYLSSVGILSGYPDKTFGGNRSITRAEFTKLLTLAFKLSSNDSVSRFSDVGQDVWFFSYINAAADADIVSGFPDNTFRPDDIICRQDMAVMIYRVAAPKDSAGTLIFDDTDKISPYAVSAVNALCSSGIINGTGNNMFSPTAPATRAQAAQIIFNILHI